MTKKPFKAGDKVSVFGSKAVREVIYHSAIFNQYKINKPVDGFVWWHETMLRRVK